MGEFDFPCPDCRERSFATEAGLYMHRFVSVFNSCSDLVSVRHLLLALGGKFVG